MDDLRLMLADNVVVAETPNAKYPDFGGVHRGRGSQVGLLPSHGDVISGDATGGRMRTEFERAL